MACTRSAKFEDGKWVEIECEGRWGNCSKVDEQHLCGQALYHTGPHACRECGAKKLGPSGKVSVAWADLCPAYSLTEGDNA